MTAEHSCLPSIGLTIHSLRIVRKNHPTGWIVGTRQYSCTRLQVPKPNYGLQMNDRVLIVDDHPAIRMAIKFFLASSGFDVVAEVGDGAVALRLINALRPSVIILDINIPIVDGLTIISEIAARKLPIKVIVFTGAPSYHLANYCRQMGVRSLLSKQRELSELIAAVNATLDNDEYFPGFWDGLPEESVRNHGSIISSSRNVVEKRA